MIRELNYQELLKISTEQLSSIKKSISKGVESEQRQMQQQNRKIPHTFFRIENETITTLEFYVGLQRFLLQLKINTRPQHEQFSIITYEIVENIKNHGAFELKHVTELDITGNFMQFYFIKDMRKYISDREVVGDDYLQRLLQTIDKNDEARSTI